MLTFQEIKQKLFSRCLVQGIILVMSVSLVLGLPATAFSSSTIALNLPQINKMTQFSSTVLVQGMIVHPDKPFEFDFIINEGNAPGQLKEEASKLIKYFLASLTVPEDDLWVNLSPYEKNRIIPEGFGMTDMGRDLLQEDYVLKQVTAAMMYPENEMGKAFWQKIYAKAHEKYGTTQIPVNTFNKVWIVPQKAVVWENEGKVLIVEAKLKVMLEEDYLALKNNEASSNAIGSQIIRELVIPALEKEVNEGNHFTRLRQIYNAMILATWYKQALKKSILGQAYADKNKVEGIDIQDKDSKLKIYQQYLRTFKQGVYNYVKEEPDPISGQLVPHKYFAGGFTAMGDGRTYLALRVLLRNNRLIGSFKRQSKINQREIDRAMSGSNKVSLVTWRADTGIASRSLRFVWRQVKFWVPVAVGAAIANEYYKPWIENNPGWFSAVAGATFLLWWWMNTLKMKIKYAIAAIPTDSNNSEHLRSLIAESQIRNIDDALPQNFLKLKQLLESNEGEFIIIRDRIILKLVKLIKNNRLNPEEKEIAISLLKENLKDIHRYVSSTALMALEELKVVISDEELIMALKSINQTVSSKAEAVLLERVVQLVSQHQTAGSDSSLDDRKAAIETLSKVLGSSIFRKIEGAVADLSLTDKEQFDCYMKVVLYSEYEGARVNAINRLDALNDGLERKYSDPLIDQLIVMLGTDDRDHKYFYITVGKLLKKLGFDEKILCDIYYDFIMSNNRVKQRMAMRRFLKIKSSLDFNYKAKIIAGVLKNNLLASDYISGGPASNYPKNHFLLAEMLLKALEASDDQMFDGWVKAALDSNFIEVVDTKDASRGYAVSKLVEFAKKNDTKVEEVNRVLQQMLLDERTRNIAKKASSKWAAILPIDPVVIAAPDGAMRGYSSDLGGIDLKLRGQSFQIQNGQDLSIFSLSNISIDRLQPVIINIMSGIDLFKVFKANLG